MTLYNLRTTETAFKITKFDSDLNPESSYDISRSGSYEWTCTCPASHRSTCRHRQMVPLMVDRVDTGWFYNFDSKLWVDPLGTTQADRSYHFAECYCDQHNERQQCDKAQCCIMERDYEISHESHSQEVKAVDFDSTIEGSNPSAATIRRRV